MDAIGFHDIFDKKATQQELFVLAGFVSSFLVIFKSKLHSTSWQSHLDYCASI